MIFLSCVIPLPSSLSNDRLNLSCVTISHSSFLTSSKKGDCSAFSTVIRLEGSITQFSLLCPTEVKHGFKKVQRLRTCRRQQLLQISSLNHIQILHELVMTNDTFFIFQFVPYRFHWTVFHTSNILYTWSSYNFENLFQLMGTMLEFAFKNLLIIPIFLRSTQWKASGSRKEWFYPSSRGFDGLK